MTETHHEDVDPNGKAPHEAGAKLDANKPRMGLVLQDFARALTEVARVGTYGAQKYSDHGWTQVENGVDRYTDAMFRHLLAEVTDGPVDEESGLMHAAMAAWNALARLDLMLRDGDSDGSGLRLLRDLVLRDISELEIVNVDDPDTLVVSYDSVYEIISGHLGVNQ